MFMLLFAFSTFLIACVTDKKKYVYFFKFNTCNINFPATKVIQYGYMYFNSMGFVVILQLFKFFLNVLECGLSPWHSCPGISVSICVLYFFSPVRFGSVLSCLPYHFFFSGIGSIGRLGLLRRVQPYRTGGALRGGATDPDHPAGHRTQGCEILFRGHNAKTGSDLYHIHNHESRVSGEEIRIANLGNSSCGFTHRIFSALLSLFVFFFLFSDRTGAGHLKMHLVTL